MVRISPVSTGSTQKTSAKKRAASSQKSSGFSGLLSAIDNDGDGVATVREPMAASGVNPLLGLQEISDEEASRRHAVKRGHDTLDTLEELRNALLIGSVPSHLLHQIEHMVQQQRQVHNDPQLHALLDDIELRAAVELAKIQVALDRRS